MKSAAQCGWGKSRSTTVRNYTLLCICKSSKQTGDLANAGHDTRALQAWLGYKNIQHTVRYTELSPDRFRDFLRD
jgi:hypothetical protein